MSTTKPPTSLDGNDITPEDLVAEPGRLGQDRMCCPHPDCPWWVPEGQEHLADSHHCVGPVYTNVDRSGLVDTSDVEKPEDYFAKFLPETGPFDEDEFVSLAKDAIPRPRSERLRLLFDFDAFGYQRAILDDPNPDASVNMGRQVGKTETGGAIGADAILFSAIPTGDDVAFFGDVQDTASEMFRRCKKHLNNCPIPLDKLGVEKDNETYWEFLGDSRLLTMSLNNGGDNERGKLPKVAIVDEAALCERSAFSEVVEPMFMTHGDAHEMFVMSTPRGQTGYHYDANMPDREPEYFSAHTVPAWGNPIVSESWLRKKRSSTDSDTWRQEYLGEFVSEGNAYIPTSTYRPCQHDLPTERGEFGSLQVEGHPKRGAEYYGAVDVAGGGKDRTVYMVMTRSGTVVHIESEDKSKIPAVLGRIGALNETYDFVHFLVDQNSLGQGVVDFSEIDAELSSFVEGIAWSTPTKSAMYKALKNAFESEDIQLPKHGRLERETTKLKFEFTPNRHVRVSHPKNGHDDHPDALAMANYVRSGLLEPDEEEQDPFIVTP